VPEVAFISAPEDAGAAVQPAILGEAGSTLP
jgi:hypothetical protein